MTFIKNLLLIFIWFIFLYFIFLFQPLQDFESYIFSLKPENSKIHIEQIQSVEKSELLHLYLTIENDTSLSAYLKVPSDSAIYSSIIVLGGMLTGKYAVNYAYGVNNVILAAPDYRYKPKVNYDALTIFSDLSDAYNATYLQVVDNLLLIEFLNNWERTKNSNISILGYSFGVPFAAATARFNKADYLALVYGGADLKFLIKHNLKLFNQIVDYVLANLFWLHVVNFEPDENLQYVNPIPTLVINGVNDEKIPDISSQKLLDAINFEKKVILIDSKHVHPADKKLSLKIIDYLTSWHLEENFFD